MATIGQKISEFITRGETYLAQTFYKIVEKQESGEEYEEDMYKLEGLYSFLIELQGLYNQWTDREIQIFIDYWDEACRLKAMMGVLPDPYRHYENLTAIISQTTSLEVPSGNGFLFQNASGVLVIYPDADVIESEYGLPTD